MLAAAFLVALAVFVTVDRTFFLIVGHNIVCTLMYSNADAFNKCNSILVHIYEKHGLLD